MTKLICLSGLPGSGKSRIAKAWMAEEPVNRLRVNYDDLRIAMYGEGWKFNLNEENRMKDYAKALAIDGLKAGRDVMIDNTNLTDSARSRWERLAKSYKADYEQVEVDTPIATCVERDLKRVGIKRVGRAVIERMALEHGFIDWDDASLYPRDFIVVDMDGTLADCEWRRHWIYPPPAQHRSECDLGALTQWTKKGLCAVCGVARPKKNHDKFYENVEKDGLIHPIINLVDRLHHGDPDVAHRRDWDLDVLIVSGRPINKAGKGTEDWLNTNCPFEVRHLFMRAARDFRDDTIVKEEILALLPKDRIRYVLDDRDRVVQMWRKHGLTTLQVANGNF